VRFLRLNTFWTIIGLWVVVWASWLITSHNMEWIVECDCFLNSSYLEALFGLMHLALMKYCFIKPFITVFCLMCFHFSFFCIGDIDSPSLCIFYQWCHVNYILHYLLSSSSFILHHSQ
jgi:hypothetical protein